MQKIITFCLLLPFICTAQENNSGKSQSHSQSAPEYHCSSWQNLQRPTLRNPLCTFYRFQETDGKFKLELKISAGGLPFVVAKNALLQLETEEGDLIELFNDNYTVSCRGCGGRTDEANRPGVTLSFDMTNKDISLLDEHYLAHIRLHLSDYMLGGTVNLRRSETFMQEINDFTYHIGK